MTDAEKAVIDAAIQNTEVGAETYIPDKLIQAVLEERATPKVLKEYRLAVSYALHLRQQSREVVQGFDIPEALAAKIWKEERGK